MKNTLLVTALAAASIAALAGCTTPNSTTGGNSASSSSPTPTPTPTATSTGSAVPVANKCVDGQALLTGTGTDLTFAESCDTVYVLTNGATIAVGPTKKLVFEGTGNTVTVSGDKPEIVGGEKNTVKTR